MSATRSRRFARAATLVPLALLSAAWTANLAGVGATVPVAAGTDTDTVLPNGVPSEAIEAPAPVSTRQEVSRGFDGDQAQIDQIVSTSSTNGIPSAALAAYQRAETVVDSADKSCHLTWQLVAAIGRVESNHGRFGGSALNADGVATPAIRGPLLDGSKSTSVIRDTDAGLLDGSRVFDRAVGPMQFIPSTWSVVGVDADNDGERNPQDIDDAALATAVYLCSGKDDLSTDAGRQAAVYRYNHSKSYVDLVLRIMDGYLKGDYTSVPNGTTSGGYITQADPTPTRDGNNSPDQTAAGSQVTLDNGSSTSPGSTGGGIDDNGNSDNGSTDNGSTGGGDNGNTGGGNGGNTGGGNGGNGGNNGGGGDGPLSNAPDPVQPVVETLTYAQALVLCGLQLDTIPDPLGLIPDSAAATCAKRAEGTPKSQANGVVSGIVNNLLAVLGL